MLRPNRSREGREILDKTVYVVRIVLNRDQPLLGFAPRRQEDAAVVLEQPVGVAVGVVDFKEVAEVADRLGGEDHAALGADRHDPRLKPVSADLPLYPLDGS